MRRYGLILFILCGLCAWGFLFQPGTTAAQAPKKGKLLMMTLTAGFRHQTVPLSEQVVTEIGRKSGAFDTVVTQNVNDFTAQNLAKFDAILFNTTGELPMNDAQKKAFLDFVRGGKGFVGVHSATDTFYMWEDYADLVGGYFNGHPWHTLVTVEVVDPSSPLVGFLGKSFQIHDEIYQTSDFRSKDSTVLLRLDPSSVELRKPGVTRRYYGWPLAWTRPFGKGRVYYNALGHDEWVWNDARFQEMLLKGIQWAMGLNQ